MGFTLDSLTGAHGATVYDSSGEKIGSVEEVFYDQHTRQPDWIGLGTGFFGTKRVLVPVEGLKRRGDGYGVPYTKDVVKDSPDIDSDEISESLEQKLYSYYGLQRSKRRTRAGRGDIATGRQSVTRSEEEVHVGKERVQTGQVRLRKWVETEQVQVPVELRKEKVAVEREALDQPISRDQIGEKEAEITLSEERPVVEKQAVAKERVTVGKDVDKERRTIGEKVRKERVDIDDDTKSR